MLWKKLFAKILLPIIALITGLFSIYLAGGTINVARDVLKSLVDANAALIGFLGIITVFALTSYRDSIHRTEEEIYRLRVEHEQNISPSSAVIWGNKRAELDSAEKEYKLFMDRIKKLKNRLEMHKTGSGETCSVAVRSAVYFVISILLCILAMSEVDLLVRFSSTYFACALVVVGVIGIIEMISNLKKMI